MSEQNNNTNKEKTDWKSLEIGCLWEKEAASERRYSGELVLDGKKMKILAFPNRFKDNDKKPDFKLYIAPECLVEYKTILANNVVTVKTPHTTNKPVVTKKVAPEPEKVAAGNTDNDF